MDLFGNDTLPQASKVPHKRKAEVAHTQMLLLFGTTNGKKCKGCKHFFFRVFAAKYPKCHLSGCNGASRSSDWNSRWNACGKFEPKP